MKCTCNHTLGQVRECQVSTHGGINPACESLRASGLRARSIRSVTFRGLRRESGARFAGDPALASLFQLISPRQSSRLVRSPIANIGCKVPIRGPAGLVSSLLAHSRRWGYSCQRGRQRDQPTGVFRGSETDRGVWVLHRGERSRPYLEPHHTHRLADGGLDHPAYVAGVCPTCHRRVHHGKDGDKYNESIASYVQAIEPMR